MDADYIWNRLSLARGLQYLTLWYWQNGFVCYPLTKQQTKVII